ncbi:hypothetical protein IDH44_12330 [Paenibacillus sp. IB182496]|uniref:Uncharacterized protein n=1 Tax=Paenibacillus sabuli TaxID=2772509 RepID=A0A927BSJ2_9BACL|nr:hypothetical protein [Paenibacillus sabuli]MBD2845983.1 hypothetical protein [Paenibacillus sabuli]
MTKLDGNVRWQSKMLLTEHQEQYESRHDSKAAGRATPEELTMIRDHVLLPHLLTILQSSMNKLEHAPNVLNKLFAAMGRQLMNRVSKDMYALRRELRRRNIKILNDEQADLVVYYRYVCRGYEDRFGIVREVMRAEISLRLTRYVRELTELTKEYGK